jgi:dTMP kinase
MQRSNSEVLPRFIVLEGVDGAGTTTQLKCIDKALADSGLAHWTTFEPTNLSAGLLIRRILGGELSAAPGTVAHLFAADRHEHIFGTGGILEHLGSGDAVICDRYIFSSLAYQTVACGSELPIALNRFFPLPGLLLYFDVHPEISMNRIRLRTSRDIYEELPIQEQVRTAYEDAMAGFADSAMRVVRIDASLPLSDVSRLVLDAVGKALGVPLTE